MRSTLLVATLALVTLAHEHGLPWELPNVPFLMVWNAPTKPCKDIYDVDLDLSFFDIVLNQNQSFMGSNITIFYEGKLGHYPYYTSEFVAVNGGVPQNASLRDHLSNATVDIQRYIPVSNFTGLAVVDWESWRPIWKRNWDTKKMYWEGSCILVRKQHPEWLPAQVEAKAKEEFENASRAFMERTLQLGRTQRPGGWWGFYGFPECYNYQYNNISENYTGACPDAELKLNDQLVWLWNISSALYPHIYLDHKLKGRGACIQKFVHFRILEAERVATQVGSSGMPILPYARIAYTYSLDFLSLKDLIHTIGESAALGSAGVVLWGDAHYAQSKEVCESIKDYVDNILGSYVINVTTAAAICSKALCGGRGRCKRIHSGSSVYLHLHPDRWKILSKQGPQSNQFFVVGQSSKADVVEMEMHFTCQCYQGWHGKHCKKQNQ
ncbi:hyaluronidase-1-like [Erpetoichthys calabaricus]|uniref:Hyaluronidase n=1 Tax=Erpetoichthys calabaricus TaxID=27687 RepID=A0A8C4TI11_ERPCA|nr:hyaluronidase-1-like [Erpetoichthys calabaricus]